MQPFHHFYFFVCLLAWPALRPVKASPSGKNRCERSKGCQSLGLCQSVKKSGSQRCIAVTDADCSGADICLRSGQCSAVRGSCLAVTDRECLGTMECMMYGACTARNGECVLGKDADCSQGPPNGESPCMTEGLCLAKDGACIATSSSCKQSTVCAKAGRCSEQDGQCVAKRQADCKRSEDCKLFDTCALDKKNNRCVFSSNDSCKRLCSQYGHCTRRGQRCIAINDLDCRRGKLCRQTGQCTAALSNPVHGCQTPEGTCFIASDSDCRRSAVCKRDGKCVARGECADGDLSVSCERPEASE